MKKPRASAAAAAPPDPAADLLAQADRRTDVLQFSEWNPQTGRPDYIEQIPDIEPVQSLGLEEFIRQRYGGGKYYVRIRRKTGKYGPSATVSVAGDPKPREAATNGAAAPAAAASAGAFDLMKIMMALAVPAATAFGTMIAKKILEGPPPAPDRVKELGEILVLVKNASGGGADPLDPREQAQATIDFMRTLTEYQKSLMPEERPSRGGALERLADRVAVPVINLMERKLALDEGRGGQRRTADRSSGPASPPGSPAASTADDGASAAAPAKFDDPLAELLSKIPIEARQFLLNCAAGDKDPTLYAELTLDRLEDRTYRELAAEIHRADALEVLLAINPPFAEYREWFDKFVNAIRASLAGGTPETEAPGGGAAERVPTATPAA